jgi:PTS hybrid protein
MGTTGGSPPSGAAGAMSETGGTPTNEAGTPTSETSSPTSEAGTPTSETSSPTSEAGDAPMVGIVLVSHSAALAAEVAALAAGIGGEEVPVAAAGGTDDGGLGTSADKVAAAIERVDGGAGVVLIPDLGSSVLTARLFAEPGRVVLADVPFVEGAISAVVTAGAGAPLEAVLAAAEEARTIRKLG